ncbi:MAG: hypothetical protein JNM98_17875 [Rhodocyclaceae bacterium]|nr:hypothetical protein [Rhodocyclaceae bacterium]
MAMSNREKQAAFRARHIKGDEADRERLHLLVPVRVKRALERIARHHGLSQAAMLERFILDAQDQITRGMDNEQYRVFVGEAGLPG